MHSTDRRCRGIDVLQVSFIDVRLARRARLRRVRNLAFQRVRAFVIASPPANSDFTDTMTSHFHRLARLLSHQRATVRCSKSLSPSPTFQLPLSVRAMSSSNDAHKNEQGGKFSSEAIKSQHQSSTETGLEKEMGPTSESTKLETPGGLKEYVGIGKLRGKTALITGGDSGIGRAVAILYAREGCDSSIVYLPEEQKDAEETKSLIEKEGRKCLLLPFDLREFRKTNTLVEKHIKEFGSLNILVNNASKQVACKNIEDIDLDSVESLFQSNIIQMIALTKFALPHLSEGDSIINTTSVTAYRGSAQFLDYSSTKGAIVSFTRGLATQIGASRKIRVNAVAPGPVHTPLQPASRPADQMESFGETTMFGRPAQPSEIAPSYVFLASAEGSMFCGQVLHPNAGEILNT